MRSIVAVSALALSLAITSFAAYAEKGGNGGGNGGGKGGGHGGSRSESSGGKAGGHSGGEARGKSGDRANAGGKSHGQARATEVASANAVDGKVRGGGAVKVNFGRLISTLNHLDSELGQLAGIETPSFAFVEINATIRGANDVALQNALSRNEAELAAFLSDPRVSAALTEQEIAAESVVGADVSADGTVTVFTRS